MIIDRRCVRVRRASLCVLYVCWKNEGTTDAWKLSSKGRLRVEFANRLLSSAVRSIVEYVQYCTVRKMVMKVYVGKRSILREVSCFRFTLSVELRALVPVEYRCPIALSLLIDTRALCSCNICAYCSARVEWQRFCRTGVAYDILCDLGFTWVVMEVCSFGLCTAYKWSDG